MTEKDVNLFEEFMKVFEEETKGMGHVNLIVSGKTGVGKSTLINAAFREDLAATGIGDAVTNEIRMYSKTDFPLRIYDTMGLELSTDKQEHAVNLIKELCEDKKKSGNEDEFLHVMWYCVAGNGSRFESYEEHFINEIAEEMPVVIVLTKSIIKTEAEKLQKEIEKKNTKAKNIIVVRAQSYIDDDGKEREAFGVEKLVECTMLLIPEAKQKAWANAQKASLELKEKMARNVIKQTVTLSFGEGYIPLPFSDCIALVPTQISMIARITAIYGLELSSSMFTGIISSLVGTAATTYLGKLLVSSLLKIIPVAGTAATGTISGSTAALLTKVLGESYIIVMNQVYTGGITQKDLEDGLLKDLFAKVLKEQFGKV